MSEITEVHARILRSLTTRSELPFSSTFLKYIKIPVGNLPAELSDVEALFLGQIIDLITLDSVSPEQLATELDKLKTTMDEELVSKNLLNPTVVALVSELESQITLKADKSNTYEKSQTYSRNETYSRTETDTALSAIGGGAKAYATYALFEADKLNVAPNTPVNISEAAPEGATWGQGLNTWDGVTLTKSPNNAVQISKNYTDERVLNVVQAITLRKADDPDIICFASDAEDNALIWVDRTTGLFNAVGLFYTIFKEIFALKQYSNPNYAPIQLDSEGNMLAGLNKITHKFEAVGLELSNQSSKQYKYFAQKPLTLEINHVLSYGQSLSMGATATVVLSNSQPYSNLTFNSSPRQDTPATSVIPLVEQFNNPSADGYANRGETHCSGLANYASRAMMQENNVDPSKHIIFASTAGHGGYTIDQLKKGSSWYSVLLNHVTTAKVLNVDKSYHVPVIPWIQGENNAVSGGLQTPYDIYKASLVQLQSDADTDIKAITGQVDPVRFITYQMSYAARTWPDIAKAQLDLARENENFMLATPMYHFPYAGDNVHLTNAGYKWMGAYFGRAYKQYMVEGRRPDFINPLTANIVGNTIVVKFDVPKLPLKIDTNTLANTTNAGFKVMNGDTEIAVTSVIATEDTVTLQLASTPTNNVKVRYALDYIGTGLTITNGASGNLRDSTEDSVVIGSVTKPLYHVCPHFELTAFLDKGI